jgi:hypothetical protein
MAEKAGARASRVGFDSRAGGEGGSEGGSGKREGGGEDACGRAKGGKTDTPLSLFPCLFLSPPSAFSMCFLGLFIVISSR